MIFWGIRKKDIFIFVVVFLVIGAFLISNKSFFSKKNYSVVDQDSLPKLQVATSFSLIADWIKEVGKDKVEVRVFPAPSDSDLKNWLSSDFSADGKPKIFFFLGTDFDRWVGELAKDNSNQKIEFDNLNLVLESASSTLYKNLLNPSLNFDVQDSNYFWLSLNNAKQAVREISRKMGKVDALNKEYYINNAYEYLIKIDSLLYQSLDALDSVKNKRVVVSDPKLAVFVKDFGLDLIGVLDYKALSDSKDVYKVLSLIKKNRVAAVISENNSQYDLLRKVLLQTAASLVLVDVWGINYNSYLDFMRSNISELIKAF
jgi:zinc/manganese transport system substrate-binding protein